jgi:DNA-binding NarL/FixJ family response regulator
VTASTVSIGDAQAELAAVEARLDELKAELGPVEARANELRKQLAAELFAQAETLLARLTVRRPLTERELVFARAYAVSGESVQCLADRHCVSVNTAKSHLRKSYQKLGVRSRAQLRDALVKAARESGGGS